MCTHAYFCTKVGGALPSSSYSCRSIREIEKVKKEANELKRKLDSFTETLSVQEDNTLTSLKFLSELDNLKMKLESVFNALKEAEKLSKINETIESVFATRNFQKVRGKKKFALKHVDCG